MSSNISTNIISPHSKADIIGRVYFADNEIVQEALSSLNSYSEVWKNEDINKRINIINNFADLLEENYMRLVTACVKEAGKTIEDSISDIREAVDFCRYYALLSKDLFKDIFTPWANW